MEANLIRFEWIKARSVRSTWWSLATAAVGVVMIGALVAHAHISQITSGARFGPMEWDPVFETSRGLVLGELAIGVLGALAITAEYATGTIRSTLAAAPRRVWVLAAKVATFGAIFLLVGELVAFVNFWLAQAILHSKGVGVSLSSAGVLRAVIGAGIYLTLLGLLAVGLGAICRRTAGAIAAFFGLVLVLPPVVQAFPRPWGPRLAKFLPQEAGSQIMTLVHQPDRLHAWAGLGVLAVWAVAALIAGAVVLVRTDV